MQHPSMYDVLNALRPFGAAALMNPLMAPFAMSLMFGLMVQEAALRGGRVR